MVCFDISSGDVVGYGCVGGWLCMCLLCVCRVVWCLVVWFFFKGSGTMEIYALLFVGSLCGVVVRGVVWCGA